MSDKLFNLRLDIESARRNLREAKDLNLPEVVASWRRAMYKAEEQYWAEAKRLEEARS